MSAWRPITRFEYEDLKAKGGNVDWIEGDGYIVYDAQALAETQGQARQIADQRGVPTVSDPCLGEFEASKACEPTIGQCARCSRDVTFSDIYVCPHEHCYYRTGSTDAVGVPEHCRTCGCTDGEYKHTGEICPDPWHARMGIAGSYRSDSGPLSEGKDFRTWWSRGLSR